MPRDLPLKTTAQTRFQHGNLAAAYHRALRLQADFDLAHFNLGQVLEATQQLDAAQSHDEQAPALAPDNLRVLYPLNALRQKQADWHQYNKHISMAGARPYRHASPAVLPC